MPRDSRYQTKATKCKSIATRRYYTDILFLQSEPDCLFVRSLRSEARGMRLQVWTYCEQRRAGQLAKAVAPLLTVEGMSRTKRVRAKKALSQCHTHNGSARDVRGMRLSTQKANCLLAYML